MTLGPDLLLNPETGDLDVSGGDCKMTVDVAQAIAIRLRFVRGDWFLNTALGLPYFEEIWVKAPNLEQIKVLFREEIAATPGVLEVNDVQVELDKQTRKLTVTWAATSDSGVISGVEVV